MLELADATLLNSRIVRGSQWAPAHSGIRMAST